MKIELSIDHDYDSPLKHFFDLYLELQNGAYLLSIPPQLSMKALRECVGDHGRQAMNFYLLTVGGRSLNRIYSLLVDLKNDIELFFRNPDANENFMSEVKRAYFGIGQEGEFLGTSIAIDFMVSSTMALQATEFAALEKLREAGHSISFKNKNGKNLTFGEEQTEKIERQRLGKKVVERFNLVLQSIAGFRDAFCSIPDGQNIGKIEECYNMLFGILRLQAFQNCDL